MELDGDLLNRLVVDGFCSDNFGSFESLFFGDDCLQGLVDDSIFLDALFSDDNSFSVAIAVNGLGF